MSFISPFLGNPHHPDWQTSSEGNEREPNGVPWWALLDAFSESSVTHYTRDYHIFVIKIIFWEHIENIHGVLSENGVFLCDACFRITFISSLTVLAFTNVRASAPIRIFSTISGGRLGDPEMSENLPSQSFFQPIQLLREALSSNGILLFMVQLTHVFHWRLSTGEKWPQGIDTNWEHLHPWFWIHRPHFNVMSVKLTIARKIWISVRVRSESLIENKWGL